MWQRLHRADRVSQPEPEATVPQSPTAVFTPDQLRLLLRIAHEAIAAAVHQRPYTAPEAGGGLNQPRGVFTTLYRAGQLRGCVGYVAAVRPLTQAVAETAQAAALEDTRFAAVEPQELSELEVSLSVLSPTFPIEPTQIEIGRHGLMIRQFGRKGLLLPQVAIEHDWDVPTFLEQTCYKAGLPGNAWQHGAEIEAFTAEIFSDGDLR